LGTFFGGFATAVIRLPQKSVKKKRGLFAERILEREAGEWMETARNGGLCSTANSLKESVAMVVARENRSDRRRTTRSASVRSILALAGGAAALPLAESPVDAAIIVDSSLSGTVIGWNTGAGQTRTVSRSLPGGGGFTINTRATASGKGSISPFGDPWFGVVAAWNGAGTGVFQRAAITVGTNAAYLAPLSATVSAGVASAAFANVNFGFDSGGAAVDSGNAAFSGSSKYLLFSFDNSGTTNYGWIELTATTTGLTGSGTPYVSLYSATLGDWAYDDSGVPILAGQTAAVPEPATATLAMGGALVAGAAGLRRWRKQRAGRVAPTGEQT
jgi:hypothetical protein